MSDYEIEPDADYAYDRMRDDFLMIESESDALACINLYGNNLSNRYLPEQYKHLIGEQNDKLLSKLNPLSI